MDFKDYDVDSNYGDDMGGVFQSKWSLRVMYHSREVNLEELGPPTKWGEVVDGKVKD